MRSKGEVARMKKEKEMMKEFEQQEEARRLAHIRAMQESQQKHQAATLISLLYRRAHAKKIVTEKRTQKLFEKEVRSENSFLKSVVFLQRTVRVFLVRIWFYKQGYKFRNWKLKSARKERINRKGRHLDREELRKIVDRNVMRRLQYNRWVLFKSMQDSAVHLQEVFGLLFDLKY